MKKILSALIGLLFLAAGFSQPTIYPAPENTGTFFITHATIHVGNGTIIKDGTIQINKGKIEKIGNLPDIPLQGTDRVALYSCVLEFKRV